MELRIVIMELGVSRDHGTRNRDYGTRSQS